MIKELKLEHLTLKINWSFFKLRDLYYLAEITNIVFKVMFNKLRALHIQHFYIKHRHSIQSNFIHIKYG